jgi:hypothetical protein
MKKISQKKSTGCAMSNFTPAIGGGFGMLAIPFVPPVIERFIVTIRTISPKPKVTIAR